jgi:hypothetical protein
MSRFEAADRLVPDRRLIRLPGDEVKRDALV